MKMFRNLKNNLVSFGQLHYYAFFKHLDPVQNEAPSSGTFHQIRAQYLLVLALFLAVLIHGIILLPYQETGSLSLESLVSSNQMMFHQVTLPTLRSAYDSLMLADISLTISLLLVLLRQATSGLNPGLQLTKQGTLQSGSQILSPSVSQKILKTSRLAARLNHYVICEYASVIFTYSYLNLLLNGYSRVSFSSLFFWITEFPLYYAYVIYGITTPPMTVMLVSWYLTVRQKEALTGLRMLNESLNSVTSDLEGRRPLLVLLERYWKLNKSVTGISRDTVGYSRYFGPFLSVLFPYFIFGQCYLLKLTVFPSKKREITFIEKLAFLLFSLQFACVLSCLINACARVVRHFEGLLAENRRFYWQLLKRRQWGRLSHRVKLQIEEMQDCRRFRSATFKLAGINYSITSETFTAMFTYISVVFMYVYKN